MTYWARSGVILMIKTSKHGLHRPEITDDVLQTIENISKDMQKIDELIDLSAGNLPDLLKIGKQYPIAMKVWNSLPTKDSFVGWVNLRTGIYAPKWKKNTTFKIGDLIVPNQDNGHVYRCVENGVSGTTEPIFPTTSVSRVSDIVGAQEWTEEYVYKVGDIVYKVGDNQRLYHYRCTDSGTSGETEPKWNTSVGKTITDGTVQWQTYKTVVWEEFGVSCEFRGFGKIN